MSESSLIDWRDSQPISRLYGDVFFSRASGIEETQHVFLAQNHLAQRWRALPAHSNFIIGETGFGTGLNLLCAWQLWQQCAPADAWLHFFSVEKHPLSKQELSATLALWPQLAQPRDCLLAQYDDALSAGWHRLVFRSARITLTLAIEDVSTALAQLDVQADAWFLDGFAPSCNPAMWSSQVLQQVAQHTKAGGSFATYSAAGEVRRNLQAAGFGVERVQGHGTKREMLRGVLPIAAQTKNSKPWFKRPAVKADARHAIVIGGGLAGTSVAASLAMRGWQVDLIERHNRLAAEASGNAQGIVYTRLSGHPTPLRSLVVAGYTYSNRLLKGLALPAEDYAQCGLLQLAFNDKEAARQAELLTQGFPESFFHAVDRAQAGALCGLDVSSGGLWFPQGGWAHPPALCEALIAQPNIRLHLHCEALQLRKLNEQWQVLSAEECITTAPVVIFAGAKESAAFEQSAHFPLNTIRGQITALPVSAASANLQAVISGDAYLVPARRHMHTLGATSRFHDTSIELRAEEHAENLAALVQITGSLQQSPRLDPQHLQGRAALRVSTPDSLPLIGPLVDAAAFNIAYAALGRDAKLPIDTAAPWHEGLYVSTAHGSRGLISAPLAAELLAAYLNDEPAPLPESVMHAVHPSRFLLRDLIHHRHSRNPVAISSPDSGQTQQLAVE